MALIVLFSSAVKFSVSLPYRYCASFGATASAPPAVNASFPPAAATAAPNKVCVRRCAVLPSASLPLKYCPIS
jgi:hypothetical protein